MFRHGQWNGQSHPRKKPSLPLSEGEGKDWASLNIHSHDIEASEESILNAMRSRMVANDAM
jgi:hypothetical protein